MGFEEYEHYVMEDAFGQGSPFRLLTCLDAAVSFAVVNPYEIMEEYSFEIEDVVLKELLPQGDYAEDIAVLCVVRPDDEALYVNLRSPLIVNTRSGTFTQVILQNEAYGVSVPFSARKAS